MREHNLTQSQIDALVFMVNHYQSGHLLETLKLCMKFVEALPDDTPRKPVYVRDLAGLERIIHLLANGEGVNRAVGTTGN